VLLPVLPKEFKKRTFHSTNPSPKEKTNQNWNALGKIDK